MKFIKHYEGLTKTPRPDVIRDKWVRVDEKTYDHVHEFFVELDDLGFEIEIEQYIEQYVGGREEYRYSVECIMLNHQKDEGRFSKDWYLKFIVEYGKIFSDCALRLESHSGGMISRLYPDIGDRQRCMYQLILIMNDPII